MEGPRELYHYVNKLVEVTTKSNNRSLQGIVVTIDPETQMIFLINKEDHNKIHIINSDMVQSKTILDPVTSYENVTQEYLTNLYNRPNQIDALVRRTLSTNSKCTKLTDMLRKNNHQVIVENGIVKISDQLLILPPYGSEQCISNNKELLETVKHLISHMSVE
ncbi:uncharacterized protein LOC113467263 [Diaphorina citri]|uniref:Uncharacterized protein LOC113467263 n=1 Tax=Diaphorina citri TaxID=121845 RepID=A0A3Q0IXK9_DIACI|nr:uncharacterized protein LOC113467263 [Diaphorina citri]